MDKIEQALKPFAEAFHQVCSGHTEGWADRKTDQHVLFGYNGFNLTLGMLKNAAAALSELEGSQPKELTEINRHLDVAIKVLTRSTKTATDAGYDMPRDWMESSEKRRELAGIALSATLAIKKCLSLAPPSEGMEPVMTDARYKIIADRMIEEHRKYGDHLRDGHWAEIAARKVVSHLRDMGYLSPQPSEELAASLPVSEGLQARIDRANRLLIQQKEQKPKEHDASFDLLWIKLMDALKKRGIAPSNANELFVLIGDLRKSSNSHEVQPKEQGAEPYAWTVSGTRQMYFGEYAESDARMEAKKIGGTAVAFPLFRQEQGAEPVDEERELADHYLYMGWLMARGDGPMTEDDVRDAFLHALKYARAHPSPTSREKAMEEAVENAQVHVQKLDSRDLDMHKYAMMPVEDWRAIQDAAKSTK